MPATIRYRVIGMDCAKDAAEIEAAARGVAEVRAVKVSTATQVLSLDAPDSPPLRERVEAAVGMLGYQLQLMSGTPGALGSADAEPAKSLVTPAYKRALWIVVVLNVGYGVVEMAGGFASRSQALKADALDFLGDGRVDRDCLTGSLGGRGHWRPVSPVLVVNRARCACRPASRYLVTAAIDGRLRTHATPHPPTG